LMSLEGDEQQNELMHIMQACLPCALLLRLYLLAEEIATNHRIPYVWQEMGLLPLLYMCTTLCSC